MAHWDDSGTAVGYEGEEGDKLIQQRLCSHDYLSQCCGYQEHHDFSGLCSKCKEHSTFECECGLTRESRNS
jgi:hypothetical protein